MPKRTTLAIRDMKDTGCGCPVTAFHDITRGKYKVRILWGLKDGPRRYGQIKKKLLSGGANSKEISPRVLSRELKGLLRVGLLHRTDYGTVQPKVDYRLTPAGRRMVPVIAALRAWSLRHFRDKQ